MRLHQVNSPKVNKNALPHFERTKCSYKKNGVIRAYAANTNQGLVRKYNEDRVSIILNISRPTGHPMKEKEWPSCSYFGIFDGHGGSKCADFLRDHLHSFIIGRESFPKDVAKAIKDGCAMCEEAFLTQAQNSSPVDRSGSCCIAAMMVDDLVYVINVGDSRAVLSRNNGETIHDLSQDHKPDQQSEGERIYANGG